MRKLGDILKAEVFTPARIGRLEQRFGVAIPVEVPPTPAPDETGCFCGGAGGTDPVAIAIGGRLDGVPDYLVPVDISRVTRVARDDGSVDELAPTKFRKVCPCPSGDRHLVEVSRVVMRLKAEAESVRVAARFASCAAPDEYAGFTWATYPGEDRMVVGAMQAWVEAGDWLLMDGPVGTGKTALAVIALMELQQAGKSGLFLHAPRLLAKLAEAATGRQRDGEPSLDELLDLATVPDVLVIDDVGFGDVTEPRRRALHLIVNARYGWAGKRTIFTTNLSVEKGEFSAWVGAATASRINQRAALLTVGGRDLREPQG